MPYTTLRSTNKNSPQIAIHIWIGSGCVPARGHSERARVRARSLCPFAHRFTTHARYYQKSVMAENTTLHVGQKFSNKNHDKHIDPKLKYATLQYVCKWHVIVLHYPTQTPVLLSGSRLYRHLFLRLTNWCAEHLNRQLVLGSRWGKGGLPYPHPLPCKKTRNITLYWPIFGCGFCRFCFLSKTLFRLRLKIGLGWVLGLGLGSGPELGFRVRLRNR